MSNQTFQINKDYEIHALMVGAYCAGSLFLLLFSPILTFAFTGFILINTGVTLPKLFRIFFATLMLLSLSMIVGDRPIYAGDSNDIEGYYYVYQAISDGDLSYITYYGNGIEFGLPLLFFIFGLFLPKLSIHGLMFCTAFTSSLLLLIWVEKTFYSDKQIHRPALIGLCILLLNLYFSTQLIRQFFSLIILLYAFSTHSRSKKYFYVALAASFHLTAIAFWLLYMILRRGRTGWIFVIVLALVLRYIFTDLVSAQGLLPLVIAHKLEWYDGNIEQYTITDIASLRIILLLCAISLLVFLSSQFRPRTDVKKWLVVSWFAACIHIILLPIPLGGLRTTLIINSILPGLFVYKMLENINYNLQPLCILLFNIMLVSKTFSYIYAGESDNLFSAIGILKGLVI